MSKFARFDITLEYIFIISDIIYRSRPAFYGDMPSCIIFRNAGVKLKAMSFVSAKDVREYIPKSCP